MEQARRDADELNTVGPILLQKQQDINLQLQALTPTDAEFWKLKKEQTELQMQGVELQQKAAHSQAEVERSMVQSTVEFSDAQAAFAEAVIKANPNLSRNPFQAIQTRMRAVVPALIQKYKALATAQIEGETDIDRLKRLTEAEGVKSQILDAAGQGANGGGTIWTAEALVAVQRAQLQMAQFFRRNRRPAPIPGDFDPMSGAMSMIPPAQLRGLLQQLGDIEKPVLDLGVNEYGDASLNGVARATGIAVNRNATPNQQVVFAPQVTALDPNQLRQMLMQMVDQLMRQTYPNGAF
jgi:hypothetical protein